MNIVDIAINGNISQYNNLKNTRTIIKPQQNQLNNYKEKVLCSFTGSAIGILSTLGLIFKQAKKTNPKLLFKNLQYEEKDILKIGFGSISGGVLGGSFIDKDNKIPKIREGLMQFLGNLACPLTILHYSNKLLDKSNFKLPQFDNNYKLNTLLEAAPKITATIGSLYFGMHIGNHIMNKVNNMIFDKKENREVHSSDYLVHADDVCIAASLLLKDNKNITSIMSKALPASFILAGTKSGMQ